MVVSGFALPVTLAHSKVIHPMASVMAMIGGGLVYGTSESTQISQLVPSQANVSLTRYPPLPLRPLCLVSSDILRLF